MFRTIFTTLTALLKSSLCGTQLCIRSDTASYTEIYAWFMNEPLQRLFRLSLSEVKSRCKLHLNLMNSQAARTLGGRGQEPGKRVIPRWWACGARQARVNCWSWAPRARRPCCRASRPVHKIEMGCSGRDKDIVMTRGNKGIRARGRTSRSRARRGYKCTAVRGRAGP